MTSHSADPDTPARSLPEFPQPLLDAVSRARELGFLGERPLTDQLAHAAGFLEVIARFADHPLRDTGDGSADAPEILGGSTLSVPTDEGPILDIGSGGGLPGLVLASMCITRRIVLLDANERRTAFLQEVVEDNGWEERVEVLRGRAEELGRSTLFRGSFSVVTARSFGAPPVVAECGSPFLRRNGLLVVSEPPTPGVLDRWPAAPLQELGLVPVAQVTTPFHYQVLLQQSLCPDRYPRRTGIPTKRPLYRVDGI